MGNKKTRRSRKSIKLMRKRLMLQRVACRNVQGAAHHADVGDQKNIQMVNLMKCAKCGATNRTSPELSFYKFPFPNLEGSDEDIEGLSADRCRAWAEYCWPDKCLTPQELMDVRKEEQRICSKHFPDKETAKRLGLQLGMPADFPTEKKTTHIVPTYGKKVDERTDSNIASNNLPKHSLLNAGKKVIKSKDILSTEKNQFVEINFSEGVNVAQAFEAIDEVFEDRTDVSMYEETVVKIEPCDSLLHEGYECNLCLSSISGYRYTCVQCEDVDLCAACEASGAHAAHYVLRVPRPRPEEEVQELLKELRDILKKRPPSDPPAETITIPIERVPVAEDPLLAPAPPDVPSADQSESDDGSTESESEDDNVPERPDIATSPPASTSHVELNLKNNQTSREDDEITPKLRKPGLYQIAMPTRSKIADMLIVKCTNANTSNKTPFKHVVSHRKVKKPVNLANTLKVKLKSILELALTSETVQQAKAQVEARMQIDKDNVKLKIDDENYLGKGDIDSGKNAGPSHINEIRSRRGDFDTEYLRETLIEEPLDIIMQQEHFIKDDPSASGEAAKACPKTENIQIVKVKDVKTYSNKRKSKGNTLI